MSAQRTCLLLENCPGCHPMTILNTPAFVLLPILLAIISICCTYNASKHPCMCVRIQRHTHTHTCIYIFAKFETTSVNQMPKSRISALKGYTLHICNSKLHIYSFGKYCHVYSLLNLFYTFKGACIFSPTTPSQ